MRGNDLTEHRAFWAGVTVGVAEQAGDVLGMNACVDRLPCWERGL